MESAKGDKHVKKTLPPGMHPLWEKGKSGNPNGRPTVIRYASEITREYLNAKK